MQLAAHRVLGALLHPRVGAHHVQDLQRVAYGWHHGNVILTTSVSGLFVLRGQATYGAAKCAVVGQRHLATVLTGFRIQTVAHIPKESLCLDERAGIESSGDVAVDCFGSRIDSEERGASRRCEFNQRRSLVVRVRHEPDQGPGREMIGCPLHALPYQS